MTELYNFISDELLPRVLENMDTIFPERKWTKKGYRWSSPFHVDGTESQSGAYERSYIKTDSNHRYSVGETDGGNGMSLINYSLIYKGYARGAKGPDFIDTVKWLCDKVNLEMPQFNSEEYQQYKMRVDAIQDMCNDMQKALFTEEGKEVLAYLTEVRGYDVELIKKMGLGFISEEMANRINSEKLPLSFNPTAAKAIESGEKSSLPYGVGRSHQLAISYMCGNHIRGFKFREIQENLNKDGKPLPKYYNNYGLPKGQYLFGFRGFHLTGNGEKDRDITIVEGELDALHAQVLGLDNVVAAAGGNFSDKVIEEARAKGVERITLLYDTEETEEKQESTYKKIEKGIEKINGNGLTAFYADLPSENGKKMDVDEFLRHHTIDELKEIIDNAIPASYYLFEMRLHAAIKQQEADGELTSKNLDEFMKRTIEVANSVYTTPVERDMIFRKFEKVTGSQIRKEVIEEVADIMDSQNTKKQTQRLIENKLQNLLDKIKNEGYKYYLDSINNLAGDIRKELVKKDLVDYLADDTDDVFESYKEDLKVVNTDLELSDNFGGKFRFVMPPGITTIAAHTGHGKSKVMQHFALNEAIKDDEGCVVYIPYEESKKQVIANMLNVYANIELTKKTARHGNMQTILEYLHDGSTKFMKADAVVPFQRKVSEFKELLHQRRIKVVKPETPYISELKTILNSITTQREIKIKCVFIDYIQELYIENTKVQRADELKEVMVELDMFSQRNNIPVIVAAQLKRETADSPLMLTNQCIADSSWIERKSSEIIIIWSNKEKCKNDPKGQLTKKANEEIPGLELGTGGKIFFVQTKSRINPVGTTALLEINGNTGRIEGNYVAPDPQQEIVFQVSATANTRTFDFD